MLVLCTTVQAYLVLCNQSTYLFQESENERKNPLCYDLGHSCSGDFNYIIWYNQTLAKWSLWWDCLVKCRAQGQEWEFQSRLWCQHGCDVSEIWTSIILGGLEKLHLLRRIAAINWKLNCFDKSCFHGKEFIFYSQFRSYFNGHFLHHWQHCTHHTYDWDLGRHCHRKVKGAKKKTRLQTTGCKVWVHFKCL